MTGLSNSFPLEADRRKKKLSDTLRDLIADGLEAFPLPPDTPEVIAETWEQLGPAPEVIYEKLSASRRTLD
jgi:hypothetical protein